MKNPCRFAQKSSNLPALGNRRGIALVSVLAVLILLTVLVVAFLMRAEVARTSSANYRATTSTRLLADTVVNLVQAEINDATSYGTSTVNAGATPPYTWASQPGAIRVYDSSGTGTGASLDLQKIYRLYSAPSLTTSNITDLINTTTGTTTEITSAWVNSPSTWVDLNAPVTVAGMVDANNHAVSIYPILDPRDPTSNAFPAAVLTAAKMPGFALPAINTFGATTAQPAPMPVQWLYVFQNGQIVAPDTTSTGTNATFNNAATKPSATNPIIGRIAFWTDDETCKVNINTAAGSVSYRTSSSSLTKSTTPLAAPWDTPRYGGSWEDLKLFAADQPVQGEYQRYPGHPATTLLYPILAGLSGGNATSATLFYMPEISNVTSNSYKLAYTNGADTQSGGSNPWPYTSSLFGLLPRYNDDYGSQAGIANTTASNQPTSPTTKRYRLYTSLGELFYSTTLTGTTTTSVRSLNGIQQELFTSPGFGSPNLTRQQIETGKFFLTAHSRAPEVTLFGTPRVAMWPIPDPSKTSSEGATMAQTTFDKLIAFCSTTDQGKGGTPAQYYFQRYDRMSTTNDWANETRNQAVYGYLEDLTSSNIPGYSGGSFSTKYGVANERDQILTEMVDYIRSTNLNDHSGIITQAQSYCSNLASPSMVMPLTITAPRTSSVTSGLGRTVDLSEVGIHVICTADGNSPLGAYVAPAIIPAVHATIPVSSVAGSANDPKYVSNLIAPQWLRKSDGVVNNGGTGTIVDITGATVTPATPASMAYQANPTLSTNGTYTDPTTTAGQGTSWLTPLTAGQQVFQAMLVMELSCPMEGYDMMLSGSSGPSVNIFVAGLQNIQIAGQNPFPNRTDTTSSVGPNVNGNGYLNGSTPTGVAGSSTSCIQWNRIGGWQGVGGTFGFRFPLFSQTASPIGTTTATGTFNQTGTLTITTSGRTNGWSGNAALYSKNNSANSTDTVGANVTTKFGIGVGTQPYRFVSNPFKVSSSTGFTIGGGGSCTISLEMPVVKSGSTTSVPYQTYTVAFPSSPTLTPTLCTWGLVSNTGGGAPIINTSHAPDWWGFDNRIGWTWQSPAPAGITSTTPATGWGVLMRGDNTPPAAGAWSYSGSVATISGTGTGSSLGDAFRSVVPKDCDYRLTMAKSTVTADPTPSTSDFMTTPLYSSSQNLTHMLTDQSASASTPGVDLRGTLLNSSTYATAPSIAPKVPTTFTYGPNPQLTYDWDSGFFNSQDGAFGNKPDEGNTYTNGNSTPYINQGNAGTITSYFTPNRMLASPVAFGSLPTGVTENIPWRTLLFRPQLTTAQGGIRPVGTTPTTAATPAGPKDYLLLDNFWMPVVQPYAISEPFSTAGKINMNYQILPFTYITRSTGIQAVLGSELIARVPLSDATIPTAGTGAGNQQAIYEGAGQYQTESTTQSGLYAQVNASRSIVPSRLPINLSTTNGSLRQFVAKFNSGDIFRSPAEICDIYLVPVDSQNAGLYTGWTSDTLADQGWYGSDFGLVGDNVREHPYGDMYPRLTTKSNTFTIYYKVQALKNPPAADPTQWFESTGVMTGEYRGSTTIERYLDPSNITIPDYTVSAKNPASTPAAASLDNYYQWRTVANTAFAP